MQGELDEVIPLACGMDENATGCVVPSKKWTVP